MRSRDTSRYAAGVCLCALAVRVFFFQAEDGIRDYKVTGVQTCFFSQAEDGIRDYKVTGVQTCALPISQGARAGAQKERARRGSAVRQAGRLLRHRPEAV